jgi:hypothetical protein
LRIWVYPSLFEVRPEPARGAHGFIKSQIGAELVENCCLGDTGELLLRCGKALAGKRKRPERANSGASRPFANLHSRREFIRP